MPNAKFITNNSPGAPTLSDSATSPYNVIKWAMQELGWTLEFDDETERLLVFRNRLTGFGTGKYLQFNCNSSNHNGQDIHVRVRGFNNMTDVDVGTGQFGNTNAYIYMCPLNATDNGYIFAGDDRSMWLLTESAVSGKYWYWPLGDIAAMDPSDSSGFIMSGQQGVTSTGNNTGLSSVQGSSAINASNNTFKFAADSDNSTIDVWCVPYLTGRFHGSNTNLWGSDGTPSTKTGLVLTSPMMAWEGNNSSDVTAQLRGVFRGFVTFLHDVVGVYSQGDVLTLKTPIGDRECMVINGQWQYANASSDRIFALDMGDWDDWDNVF